MLVKEVAEALKLKESTVRTMVHEGKLVAQRRDTKSRREPQLEIDPASVLAWVNRDKTPKPRAKPRKVQVHFGLDEAELEKLRQLFPGMTDHQAARLAVLRTLG